MRTLKRLLSLTQLVTIIGVAVSFTACSDDEENTANYATVDGELITRGITTEMESAIIDVPVKAVGQWAATIDEDCDWAGLQDHEIFYNGDKTLRVVIDENRTGIDRKSKLYIVKPDKSILTIDITQTYTYKGEAPTNGSGLHFANNGVGCGVNYEYVLKLDDNKKDEIFDPTSVKKPNNLFNFKRIMEHQTQGALENEAYVEARIPIADLKETKIDSSLCQSKSVKISLDLACSFGFIEFNAKGEYLGKKQENRVYIDYTILRNAPTYNVTVSPAEISTFAEDSKDQELLTDKKIKEKLKLIDDYEADCRKENAEKTGSEELTKDQEVTLASMRMNAQRPSYGGVFSTGFAKRYYQLSYYVSKREYDKAKSEMNTIDNLWGPFFITGGNFGGSLTLYAKVDTIGLVGKDSITGAVSANINSMFELEGSATISSEGQTIFRNSKTSFGIYGGNAGTTANKLNSFFSPQNDFTDQKQLQAILKEWMDSLEGNGEGEEKRISQAAPISFTITPIWQLFDDSEVQEFAENYFREKYKDQHFDEYLKMINGDPSVSVSNLLGRNNK